MFNRSLLLSLSVSLLAFASSGVAHAGAVTAVPCAAKAKAVIANVGQSLHNAASTVQGDVQAGGAIIKNGSSAVITGTQTPNTPAHLAVVPPPAGAKDLGNFVVSGTVTLAAGNYVATSVNMNGGSTLKVSGLVQIWVSGGVNLTGTANAGGDPTNLELLLTGNQGVNVNGNTNFTGFIYAPDASVLVGGVVNGSVVGSSTTLNSGGQVIFVPAAECPAITGN